MVDYKQTNTPVFQKLTKYILMALIVVVTLHYIPNECIKSKEIFMIAATSSITFAILDMVSPSIVIKSKKNQESFSLFE